MTNIPVKTRFAPSPSGAIHAGNLRTALFSVLFARHHQGQFLLRIEDSDSTRSDPAAIEGIQDDLRWLGLDWDEGPGEGVAVEQYQQSARRHFYAHAAKTLVDNAHAYWCFCSEERLSELRMTQQAAGKPPRYDGCCASVEPDQAKARLAAGESAVVRLRMPDTGGLAFDDLVRGRQSVDAAALGDPIIQRADGSAAFLFANALDDALMGVTHVLRGEDHLSNTPRQQILLARLGYAAPQYGHVSLVVGQDGAPLSKRTGAVGVASLREQGYRPEAVINYLARLGNPTGDEHLHDLDGLAASFDPQRLSRSPARFDFTQLDHWQSAAMASLPIETLLTYLELATVPAAVQASLAELVRPNLHRAEEINAWAMRLFDPAVVPIADESKVEAAGTEFFERIEQILDNYGDEDWSTLRPRLETMTERRGGQMMKPLRLALTGLSHGPALGEIIRLMPTDIRRARLQRAMAIAGAKPNA
ncbi:MAG: glutamate--tRNA ligase [Spiribacter sp.]|jgi:glutamyl-tRNA synthetase|nr:glutamate--tRNA ligase [Spiribacter sp.]MDR9488995.1 glutamate--tRNA ligase [Spiribacter sp.]